MDVSMEDEEMENKEVLDYFCCFCHLNNFTSMPKIKEHIKIHIFGKDEIDRNVNHYFKNWLIKYFQYQDTLSRSKSIQKFQPFYMGCPLCDTMADIYKFDLPPFENNQDLRIHIKEHLFILDYCTKCKVFLNEIKMAKHNKKHHNGSDEATLERTLIPQFDYFVEDYIDGYHGDEKPEMRRPLTIIWNEDREKNYFCLFCPGRRFHNFGTLTDHYAEHVINEFKKNSESTKTEKKKAMVFFKKWIDEHTMFQKTLFIHNSNFQLSLVVNYGCVEESKDVWRDCPVCETICACFDFKPNPEFFKDAIEDGNIPGLIAHIHEHLGCFYICPYCKETVMYKYRMARHMRENHPNAKPKNCEYFLLKFLSPVYEEKLSHLKSYSKCMMDFEESSK